MQRDYEGEDALLLQQMGQPSSTPEAPSVDNPYQKKKFGTYQNLRLESPLVSNGLSNPIMQRIIQQPINQSSEILKQD